MSMKLIKGSYEYREQIIDMLREWKEYNDTHDVNRSPGIIIFTTGEILGSISKTPYLTKRIPETHRGRVLSITTSCAGLIGVLSNYVIGTFIDYYTFRTVWIIIAVIGLFVMSLYSIYLRLDRKAYPGLYSK